ncbi:MAG: hypothetical protein GXO76_13820 [Calditrichaeota bacterium]|nr:hypothetical protein [Calditrichota bacterium]
MSKRKNLSILAGLVLGVVILSFGCSKQPLAPNTETQVHFAVRFLQVSGEKSHPGTRLAKGLRGQGISEVKVVVLDLTKYATAEEFYQASYNPDHQTELPLYLQYRIPWTDWMGQLKNAADDLYSFYGEFALGLVDTSAEGEIHVNPGLNFFGLAFLEDGEVKFLGTAIDTVAENRDNSVRIFVHQVFKQGFPSVEIYSPQSESTFPAGEEIAFNCSAWDEQDGALQDSSVQWISSLDGPLGVGTQLFRNDLSAGTHTIRVLATDRDGHTSTAAVRIYVR